jgi:hypothetical protein
MWEATPCNESPFSVIATVTLDGTSTYTFPAGTGTFGPITTQSLDFYWNCDGAAFELADPSFTAIGVSYHNGTRVTSRNGRFMWEVTQDILPRGRFLGELLYTDYSADLLVYSLSKPISLQQPQRPYPLHLALRYKVQLIPEF